MHILGRLRLLFLLGSGVFWCQQFSGTFDCCENNDQHDADLDLPQQQKQQGAVIHQQQRSLNSQNKKGKEGPYWIYNDTSTSSTDMSVDVILTVYNRSPWKQLEMIQQQSLQPQQIFIVHNDDIISQGDVNKTITRFQKKYSQAPPIRYIHFHSAAGSSASNSKKSSESTTTTSNTPNYFYRFYVAYSMSTSRYVSIWDDDMIQVGQLWLETVCEFMAATDDTVMVGSNKRRILRKLPGGNKESSTIGYYTMTEDHTTTGVSSPQELTNPHHPLVVNHENWTAYRVDWPIHQYNVPRHLLRYFLGDPVYTYETGEDIQLAYALQQRNISVYNLEYNNAQQNNNKSMKENLKSVGTAIRNDKETREWLTCTLIQKGFQTIACKNCQQQSVVQRCIDNYHGTAATTHTTTTSLASTTTSVAVGKNKEDAGNDIDMSVDVILTVYNRGHENLWKQLQMVRQQTLKPKQIIVVQSDDYGTEDIVKTIQEFKEKYGAAIPPIRHVHFLYDGPPKYHKRFYVAYAMSTARYVSVWDDDLKVGPQWLATVFEFIAATNDTIMVGNNNRRILSRIIDPYGPQGFQDGMRYYSFMTWLNKHNLKGATDQLNSHPLEVKHQEWEAYRVDWPIQQYNLRRDHIRYLLQAPVYTYETGEDIQLAFALQQHGIFSYSLAPTTTDPSEQQQQEQSGRRSKPSPIQSIAATKMGSRSTEIASFKRDQRPREWLICRLIQLGFQTVACKNCQKAVAQRCVDHITIPSPTATKIKLMLSNNNSPPSTSLTPTTTSMMSSTIPNPPPLLEPFPPPPIFVLTMPSRLESIQSTLQSSVGDDKYKNNIFFVPALNKETLRYVDVLEDGDMIYRRGFLADYKKDKRENKRKKKKSNKNKESGGDDSKEEEEEEDFRDLSSHVAKFPISLGQMAVHMGHVRMLNEFRYYLQLLSEITTTTAINATADTAAAQQQQQLPPYAIFLEDDAYLPTNFVDTVAKVVADMNHQQQSSAANASTWEIINIGRCLANCTDDDRTEDNKKSSSSSSSSFHFNNRFELCRSGYIVHRRGLRRLIKQSFPMGTVPGDKMWHLNEYLRSFSLAPRLVAQNRADMGSLKAIVADGGDQECRENKKKQKNSNNNIQLANDNTCPLTSTDSDKEDDGWTFCAHENKPCMFCPIGSYVRFGCGNHWSPLPSEPPIEVVGDRLILCSRKVFGDPIRSMGKICQCKKPPSSSPTTPSTTGNTLLSDHTASPQEEEKEQQQQQPPQLDINSGLDVSPQKKQQPPAKSTIVITTYYGGSTGQAYRDVTETPLEMFARKYGYQFRPYDTDTLHYAGIDKLPETVEDHKYIKLDLMSHAFDLLTEQNLQYNTDSWIWWTDSDVLFDAYSNHTLEELIKRYATTAEGEDCHVILLRRKAVTSSTILVRNSEQGKDFLNAWREWRTRSNPAGRFSKFGWKDQAVLNDMLFESDGKTIREQWNWRKNVQQIDCLCTDLGTACADWFCEGVYPSKYKVFDDFAIHAAGCDSKLTPQRCVEELGTLSTQRAIRSSPSTTALAMIREPIHGITVTRRASEAARAARRFFRQIYSPKKLIIVTVSKDEASFRSALQRWSDDINMVFIPDDTTTLGAQRQAGMDQVPMNSVYVCWDDDDVRAPSLLQYQYSEMMRNPGVTAVTLNAQVQLHLARNASIVVPTKPKDPKTWHGITGTIMGRRLPTTPIYKSTWIGEDTQFLQDLLDQDLNQVHVWDNPPEQFIRIYGRPDHATVLGQSLFKHLDKSRKNEWKVPVKMYRRIKQAQRVMEHPIREMQQNELEHLRDNVIGSPSSSSWCVVLTAALSPHTDVDKLDQSSVEDRTKSYRQSLKYWNEQTSSFPNVILVDNSEGGSLEKTTFQTLQQEFDKVHMIHAPRNTTGGNKGMGEKQSVFDALESAAETTTMMKSCSNILKVTGRFMPPIGLQEALEACPSTTQLVVQRHNGAKYQPRKGARVQPMESQLFGWPKGGVFEELYRRWNGMEETYIERYLFEIVKFIGQCGGSRGDDKDDVSSLLAGDDTNNAVSCKDVCFIGPLSLPTPVTRGGSGKIVDVL